MFIYDIHTIMNPTKKICFAACVFAAVIAGCQSSKEASDSLNNTVSMETQKKVYRELRAAMNLAGAEALAAYPKSGMPEGGAEQFREMQDSLRVAFWATVCNSNQVALGYGDSIWTKGVKEKWPAVLEVR